jgi:hypothetical protein
MDLKALLSNILVYAVIGHNGSSYCSSLRRYYDAVKRVPFHLPPIVSPPTSKVKTLMRSQGGSPMSVRVFALGIGIACSQGAPIHRGHRAASRRYLGGPD